GADRRVDNVGATTQVALDGSGSSDPNGDPLSYSWTQVSGPAVALSGATTVMPTFTFDPAGATVDQVVAFDLVVSDGTTSATDRVTLTLGVNPAPVLVVTQPQPQTNYVPGTPVELDASGTNDPNGDTLTYNWVQVGGPDVTLVNPNSATPTFTYDPDGTGGGPIVVAKPSATTAPSQATANAGPVTFTFQVTVSDGVNTSSPETVSITLDPDLAPVAEAGAAQTLNRPEAGAVIQLDGSASVDPDGNALTYQWSQVSGRSVSLTDVNGPNAAFTYSVPAGGRPDEERFVFSLTVNDGARSSTADTVEIVITDDNVVPVADAGTDIGSVNGGQTVQLDAGGSSDADGDTLTYSWAQVSGPSVTLQGADTATPTFTAPNVATNAALVFEVTVGDGTDTATDQVSVSVQPSGSITIIQAITGRDAGFSFVSNIPELNATLTTANGAGQLQADNLAAGSYTVTAADARDAGFALTNLVCTDPDGSVDLANRTANINLSAGEDVVCTFTSVNSREAAQDAIREAVALRSRLLLSAEPGRQRRIDRLEGRVAANGGSNLAGFQLPGSQSLPLTASASEGRMA
ncbi:MAG: hypothetical protein WBA35_13620, partial [Litorimonas sp.]